MINVVKTSVWLGMARPEFKYLLCHETHWVTVGQSLFASVAYLIGLS